MSVPEKILKKIAQIFAGIACVMILGMMLLAVLDVVLRIVFKSPIIGATEIIQILNVSIVMALGAGTIRNQHVTVDFIMDKLPRVPRFYVQLLADLLNIAILALLMVCSFRLMGKSMRQGFTYSLLAIPEWPFVGLIAVGLLGGILAQIFVIARRIREFTGHAVERPVADNEPDREAQKREDEEAAGT